MGLPKSSIGGDGPASGVGFAGGGGSGGGPVRVTIASDYAAVRVVQDRIMAEVERCGFDAQGQFAIKLALEEGLINAIKHGNKLDPAKRVHVEWSCTPAELDVQIEDEGAGFERVDVPDPTLEENIEKCSGRGILLIEAYMTSVGWSHGGRRMRMRMANRTDAGA